MRIIRIHLGRFEQAICNQLADCALQRSPHATHINLKGDIFTSTPPLRLISFLAGVLAFQYKKPQPNYPIQFQAANYLTVNIFFLFCDWATLQKHIHSQLKINKSKIFP
jgi:hypothetical protein